MDVKCPFCGDEMLQGALQTKRVRFMEWEYLWLPPNGEKNGLFGRKKKPDWEK